MTVGEQRRWYRIWKVWDLPLFLSGRGYKDMSPPTKELMKLTLEERIAHGGHKVLR